MNTAIHALETNLASTVNFTNLQRASKSITQQVDSLRIPGLSVALIDNYQIAWTKTWGVVDSATNVAVTPSTLFQAASMSKPVAALGALRMVEAGELSLSEPINNYLTRWQVPANELTDQQAVTLSHLLSHTAGTTVHGFLGYTQDLTQPTAIEILNGAKPANSAAVEVDTVPGTQHRYSGGGYTVFQTAMEDVRQQTFPQLMEELILNPVGMSQSTFSAPLPESLSALAATGHQSNGEPIEGRYYNHPEQAAASLWTTPSELAAFYLAVMDAWHGKPNSILSQSLARECLTDHSNGASQPWGLGFTLYPHEGQPLGFGHGGDNMGFHSQSMGLLDGRGAVVMTNGDKGALLALQVLQTLAREYQWPVRAPQEVDCLPLSASESASLVGDYQAETPDKTYRISLSAKDDGVLMHYKDNPDTQFYCVKRDNDSLFFCDENGGQIQVNKKDDKPVVMLSGLSFIRE